MNEMSKNEMQTNFRMPKKKKKLPNDLEEIILEKMKDLYQRGDFAVTTDIIIEWFIREKPELATLKHLTMKKRVQRFVKRNNLTYKTVTTSKPFKDENLEKLIEKFRLELFQELTLRC